MNLLFINLPPYVYKKPDNALYSLQASMNLGMLAVASAAERQGHSVVAYDWLGPQQFPLMEVLPTILADFRPDVVGFSIPSGYAEPYLKGFAERVKEMLPSAKIVVGGQYHAGFRAQEILSAVPEVDAVATGVGETIDWECLTDLSLDGSGSGLVRRNTRDLVSKPPMVALEPLRWNLSALDLRSYAPSVEIGRGCPFTCSFCSLSGAPEKLTRANVKTISDQLSFWIGLWPELKRVPVYAECPVFFCNARNFAGYQAAFGPFAERLEWRTQARVDSIEPALFSGLYQLGLRVIDLGLESASPRMLRLMNKARNPERYLEQAAAFIEGAAAAGIGVKLNILLYPGENHASANETEEFIARYKDQLAGIAAGSALEFPGTAMGSDLPQLCERFGTQRVHDPVLAEAGIYPLDLSSDFSFEDARAWCVRVSRRVMSAEKYYDLKRIGYYPPSLTFEEFLKFARQAPSHALPFSLEASGALADGVDQTIAERVVGWDQLR